MRIATSSSAHGTAPNGCEGPPAPVRLLAIVALLALAPACAARVVPEPPVPDFPKYPEFVFPSAPAAGPAVGARQDRAWRFLQNGDLRNAEREFDELLKGRPKLAPAETGRAYVALARGEVPQALERFDRALGWQSGYAPALVGRGQALLSSNRSEEALQAFEAAMAADPTLDLGARIAVLRLRSVQDRVAAARVAAERKEWTKARDSYRAAIAASPDSGFLYRELASVERRAEELDQAIEHYRKALELDAADVRAQIGLGEVLELKGDLQGAVAAYTAAGTLEPSPELDQRIQKLGDRLATAALPEEYRRIGEAPDVTRADVAAALGVQLGEWLPTSPRQGVLVTDARSHWAAPWIVRAVSAGVMDPFPNHTFQPNLRIRRGDLAVVVSRMLDIIASRRPAAASAWRANRPRILDVPPSHLAHAAVTQAVGADVLGLEDGSFHPARAVAGAELLRAIDRLRSIAGPPPPAGHP
jgi:tetratricopeptide (TPR) repeat protein